MLSFFVIKWVYILVFNSKTSDRQLTMKYSIFKVDIYHILNWWVRLLCLVLAFFLFFVNWYWPNICNMQDS